MKYFILALLLIPLGIIGQNTDDITSKIDSLIGVYQQEDQSDSIRAESMFAAAALVSRTNQDSSLMMRKQLLDFGKKQKSTPAMALGCRGIGYSYYVQGNIDSSEHYFLQAVSLAEESKMDVTLFKVSYNLIFVYHNTGENEKGLMMAKKAVMAAKNAGLIKEQADALQQLGTVYHKMGDAQKSLKALQDALTISEKLENKSTYSYVLGTLGLLYYRQGETEKGLEYTLASIDELEKMENNSQLAKAYGNLAMIYNYLERDDDAWDANTKALDVFRKIEDQQSIAITLMNMGIGQSGRGEHQEGIKKIREAYEILKDHGDAWPYNSSMKLMGTAYAEKGDHRQSAIWCLKALEHSKEIGVLSLQMDNLRCVYQAYKNQGNYKKAFHYYQQYKITEDSLFSEDRAKEFAQQETQFKYEKKMLADSIKNANEQQLKNAQIDAQTAQLEKSKIQRLALFGGIGLLLLFGLLMYNRFRLVRKQRDLINQQKSEVESHRDEIQSQKWEIEEKNKEILDSISYAKRIQSAILPPEKIVKAYLQKSFILYKPKDIVAGDFYWMEHKDGKILFAAADCTGHGVPGAMVSVVCNNGLNRSVREYELTDPGKILDQTREIVIQEFEKSEEEVKDGMDIALCSLEGNNLQYAGAHNPLWIIREGEIIETKANKQPIGKFDNPQPYTTHTFELQKGDSLYIFSDGYVDQFGGEKGKKFKSKAFKNLLLSIQDKSMEDQKTIINEAFESWKGNLEQIDDVCVIGVRI